METKQKKEYAKVIIISTIMLLVAISIIFTSSISSGIKRLLYKADIKASAGDLIVHYINVGQGDSMALQMPNGKVMLIDAGPKESQNKLVEYIKNNVLKSNNYLTIDYLMLTHSDIDHSGGMCAVFAEFEVKNFFRPNIASNSEDVDDFAIQSNTEEYNEVIISASKEKGLKITTIDNQIMFNVGKVLVQIFPPVNIYSSTNKMSPIIKVSYLNKSFLFTGDIQDDSEEDLLEEYGKELNADVLKVAHHGSKTSTSVEFINTVSPEYAVICVGDNSYGHPHFNTVSNLENYGTTVFTTEDTSIRFVCGKEFFGVLHNNKIHSAEFIDWWMIALVIELCLVVNLAIIVVKLVKPSRKDI